MEKYGNLILARVIYARFLLFLNICIVKNTNNTKVIEKTIVKS